MAKKNQPEVFRPFNPDDREKMMVNLAMDRAEEQLRDGTASQSLIIHFLKLGTEMSKLEQKLVDAKVRQIKDVTESSQDYQKVIEAMQGYAPKHGTKNDDN